MDHVPSVKELHSAARACMVMAYAAGLAGVTAGTLMLRDGDIAFAIILWVITFAVGAALMGVAVVVRAVAAMTAELRSVASDVRVLVTDRSADHARTPGRDDPWSGHPPY